jgi:hypothetical protein
MDFKEFEKLVITGHDIEFEYNNNKYAIVNGSDGFHFSDIRSGDILQSYSNPMQLLINTNFDGKNFCDISKQMKEIQIY